MKYIYTTYKRRIIASIICLLLLIPVNIIFHSLYEAWPQFATKYSYLEDPRYREEPRVVIAENGYAVLQRWDEEYMSTWTYFFVDEIDDLKQVLRAVKLPDGSVAEIRLDDTEIAGIQSFIADGFSEFGIRTSWTYSDGAWYANNTDLVTGESIDFFSRQYTTRGTLQPEHLRNIQNMLNNSGEDQFMLHNDIVLPDGLRREVIVNHTDINQALDDIAAGRINGLQVETSWNVRNQAIWARQLSNVGRTEQFITDLMQLSHYDDYRDFMMSILNWIVDLRLFGNFILIMAVFIIGYTIYLQEKNVRKK